MYLVLMLVERHRAEPGVGIFGGALQPEVDPTQLPPGHTWAVYEASDALDGNGFPEDFTRVDRFVSRAAEPTPPVLESLEPRRKTVKKREAKT